MNIVIFPIDSSDLTSSCLIFTITVRAFPSGNCLFRKALPIYIVAGRYYSVIARRHGHILCLIASFGMSGDNHSVPFLIALLFHHSLKICQRPFLLQCFFPGHAKSVIRPFSITGSPVYHIYLIVFLRRKSTGAGTIIKAHQMALAADHHFTDPVISGSL